MDEIMKIIMQAAIDVLEEILNQKNRNKNG